MSKSKTAKMWFGLTLSTLLFLTGILFTEISFGAEIFDGTILLSKPDEHTMTATVTAPEAKNVYLVWGTKTGKYTQKSDVVTASKEAPAKLTMDSLKENSRVYYRLYYKKAGEPRFQKTAEYSFQTPKTEGRSFRFTVQSDSHLLNKADKTVYRKSMEAMKKFQPDFVMDLGDTFLHDQEKTGLDVSWEKVQNTTYEQRAYFDLVSRYASVFFVIGNHEGEYGYLLGQGNSNLAKESTLARKLYFPNPVPNTFYSGNLEKEEDLGSPENYYAFQWGDALFVALDPYRYTTMDPYKGKEPWGWTLGKEQYDWLRKTLEQSEAKYKFVFAHHAIGNIRGGKEIANLYEWGGYDRNGKYLFDEKRPGWGKPIQQLMKDTHVTIFFQGHDHLFSLENVDGVFYQEIPKPAEKIADKQSNFNAYPDGKVLLNSGFIEVTVTSENVRVDYYRNYYVSTEKQSTGIVFSYTISKDGKMKILKETVDNIGSYGNR